MRLRLGSVRWRSLIYSTPQIPSLIKGAASRPKERGKLKRKVSEGWEKGSEKTPPKYIRSYDYAYNYESGP